MKIDNDKYYTPIEIANHCWEKVDEIIKKFGNIWKKEIEGFEVTLSHECIKIFNSAFCDNKKIMKNVLNDIKNNKDSCVYFKRTLKSYLREWCGHNLLFKFNIVDIVDFSNIFIFLYLSLNSSMYLYNSGLAFNNEQ